jgi:hypothetical protein
LNPSAGAVVGHLDDERKRKSWLTELVARRRRYLLDVHDRTIGHSRELIGEVFGLEPTQP